jgi:CspA family cold shock protein
MEGTVKWYNDMKSFGFIQMEEGKDVFVHRNALEQGTVLREGDRVEFEIEETDKGPQATNVKKL